MPQQSKSALQYAPEGNPQSSILEEAEVEDVDHEYEDGSRYVGQALGEKKHGRGKMFYNNGGIYEGEWEKDLMNGFGVLRNEND